MPRWYQFQSICHPFWVIGLLLTTGCAQSAANLQDAIARRVTSDEVATSQAMNRGERTGDRASTDAKVMPASAAQPGQGPEARSGGGRTSALPLAIGEPPRGANSERSSPAPALPSDSDEAALDAIAASGKPLTLPEAIDTAYRFQPRLRAQLETISQARGLQQIAFSAFLPTVAGRYDVGGFSLGVGGGNPSHLEKGCRVSTSHPA